MWLRRVGKPLVFVAAFAPFALLVASALRLGGLTLGANPVATFTEELGLWGLRLLLATLALTPLRYLTGSARWLLFRRMLGLFAYFYLALHFTMYLAVDQSLHLSVLVEDVVKRPWITLGFAALVMLTPLALTSTRAAMRWLGRRWQTLHYAIYPAAVCGVWHYYWQVKRDVRDPLLYAAVLALLLGWRLLRAVQRRSRRLAATAPLADRVRA